MRRSSSAPSVSFSSRTTLFPSVSSTFSQWRGWIFGLRRSVTIGSAWRYVSAASFSLGDTSFTGKSRSHRCAALNQRVTIAIIASTSIS